MRLSLDNDDINHLVSLLEQWIDAKIDYATKDNNGSGWGCSPYGCEEDVRNKLIELFGKPKDKELEE